MGMASYLEYSLLQPTTDMQAIESLCKEAINHQIAAVCVPPMYVKKVKAIVAVSSVKVVTVIGYPFGYHAIEAKLAETVLAVVDGADELNIMINLVALKNKDWQYLAKEINTLLAVIRKAGKKITVIIEAALLTNEEIIACCDIYGASGIDFLQTSTGITKQVVTLSQIETIRKHLADTVQLKTGDSVDNMAAAKELIAAGVTRMVCMDIVNLIQGQQQSNGMIIEKEKLN
jgi:deoxyribose-phosphate aldolase